MLPRGLFLHCQDVATAKMSREAALARPPRDPEASAPAQQKPFSVGRKPTNSSAGPKPKQRRKTVRSLPAPKQPLNRSATALVIWAGGLFGGIFGN